MSAQHTPGPWVVVAGNQRRAVRVCAKSETISVATVHSLTDQDANARLIAAAPDMLAALREYDAYMSRFYRDTDGGPMSEPNRASWKAARAAIARAEGREP
jgi:hypothetical protein